MGKMKSKRSKQFRHNPMGNHIRKNSKQTNLAPQSLKKDAASLATDLISIEDSKRLLACKILSEIYYLNSSNFTVLDRMAHIEILKNLMMRLVDVSEQVIFEALCAMTNLFECNYTVIFQRAYDCGLIELLISMTNELFESNNSISREDICCQLIQCDINIILMNSEYSNLLFSKRSSYEKTSDTLDLTVNQMIYHPSKQLQSIILELLCLSTENNKTLCLEIMKRNGITILSSILTNHFDCITHNPAVTDITDLLRSITCLSILMNLHINNVIKITDVWDVTMLSNIVSFIMNFFQPDSYVSILASLSHHKLILFIITTKVLALITNRSLPADSSASTMELIVKFFSVSHLNYHFSSIE
jgi:hypothetical protein